MRLMSLIKLSRRDILSQADASNRQLFNVQPVNGPTTLPNDIGREISIQNVGRAGEGSANCSTYPAVDNPTQCATTSVSLTSLRPTPGSIASWVLEDAGVPGVVYIYSKVGSEPRDAGKWDVTLFHPCVWYWDRSTSISFMAAMFPAAGGRWKRG